LKSKIILSGLFLTGAVSCASFKPFILTDAYLNPSSTTAVTYEDLDFTYALFNQYASGLNYSFRLDYSTFNLPALSNSIEIVPLGLYNGWHTITPTFAEGDVTTAQRNALNTILFGRQFNRVTKLADETLEVTFIKPNFASSVNFSIKIISTISYSVSIASIYMAFRSFVNANVDNFFNYIYFYDDNGDILQTFLLTQERAFIQRNNKYGLSTVLTNVKSFEIQFQWVDTPPFASGNSFFRLTEFNLFTNNQEIKIPDDTSGNVFGFEFVAVEWWDILGHLQNFAWWIVNKSPISPLFEWIDNYVITWVSGLITFITGIFRL